MEHNVFISWSKPRSYQVAKALHDWLPNVIQSAKPWISSENVDKGTLWSGEIAAVLSTVRVGIVCVTPENVADAVRELRPYAVDVASGIENAVGGKDRKKMQDFVAAAKRT